MGRLRDKVAIVTGSALGLGRATALLMAREGAKVVVTDMREADGASAVAEIEKAGGTASFFQHNVSIEDDWIKVVDETVAKYGRLDVVVNNAGIATPGSAEDASLADWRKVISVNLDGVFLGTKHGIRGIKQGQRGGAIINLSSIEGLVGDAEAKRKGLIALHPVGHLGEPDDIGWGAVYLASDEAKFITGSELVIDGGYTAQ
jgi:NAD(P)-dependent dehydrogenase (short-subunit alcohol dehydrogenase family)